MSGTRSAWLAGDTVMKLCPGSRNGRLSMAVTKPELEVDCACMYNFTIDKPFVESISKIKPTTRISRSPT